MKKLLPFLLLAVILLAACTPVQPATGETVTPGEPEPTRAQPIPTRTPSQAEPTTRPPAEIPDFLVPARDNLSENLGIPQAEITLVSYEHKNFRDGCLEVSQPGEMCLTVITPGYRAVFDTPKGRFIYHTTASGDFFRPAGVPAAIIWERSGGIAGICQRLSVYLNGGFVIEDCLNEAPLAEGRMTVDEMARLTGLLKRYGTFDWQVEIPPGSADMFLDAYAFSGLGDELPDEATRVEINDLLAGLTRELLKSTSPETGDK